jgi:hypothetical protein
MVDRVHATLDKDGRTEATETCNLLDRGSGKVMGRSTDAAPDLLLKAQHCRRLAQSAKLPEIARHLLEVAQELEAAARACFPAGAAAD